MNRHNQRLSLAIETLYETFRPYTTLSSGFGDCVWLTEADTSVLRTIALSELSAEPLTIYVENWSHCGVENDLKHYLPRLLELFSLQILRTPPEMLLLRLPYSSCTPAEAAAIDAILECMWTELVSSFPFAFGPDEFLCGLAQIYTDLAPFLDIWEKTTSIEALRQLALFSNEATYCGSWDWCPQQRQQVVDWLLDNSTIQLLENGALNYTLYADELLEGAIALENWGNEFKSSGVADSSL